MAKKNTKFRSIQKMLSAYTKKKDIHLGRDFNKAVSRIYKSNKDVSLKEIRKRIGKLYEEHKEPEKVIEFIDEFDFYNFEAEIGHGDFNGIEINVVFPELPEFSFTKLQLDAVDYYQTSGLKSYLRANYNSSPVARFVLEYTDNKTTATYRVDLSEMAVAPIGVPSVPSVPSVPKKTPPEEAATATETDKQIRLQELIKENRERQSELIDKYRSQGFSNDQIMKLLGI